MLKHFAAAVCIISATSVSVLAATSDDGAERERGFRYYPGFVRQDAVVEMAHDKGLMVEFIVRCPVGVGIITLSKVEQLYCLPDHSCTRSMSTAIRQLCR